MVVTVEALPLNKGGTVVSLELKQQLVKMTAAAAAAEADLFFQVITFHNWCIPSS